MEKPIGIVLRYADNMISDNTDTIEEHNKIFEEHGKVFIGKIGKFIGNTAIKICNDEKITKYLILVKKGKQGYVYHAAKIESAQATKPPLHLIPEYYRNTKGIKSWICVSNKLTQLDEDEINSWIIKSSRMGIANSLRKSMASYFIAEKIKPLA